MSQIGVQLTDSPYVVVNMRIMARIGLPVFKEIDKDEKRVVPCMHSVGMPLGAGRARRAVAVQQRKVHRAFPGDARDLVVRFGLRRQCAAGQEVLRAAHRLEHRARRRLDGGAHADPGRGRSARARRPTWRRRFPSACGKTNFAMLIPPDGFEGWKVWTVGDDIAWIKPDANGRLRAINPEAGFFGVAPGTSVKTNPNAMATLARNTIFTNVALTPEGGVWWEGMTDEPPAECTGLAGQPLDAGDRARRPAPRRRIRIRASPRPPRNARPSIRRGKIPTACRSARSSSAAAARPRCRWSIRRSTGARAFTSARRWARRRPPRRRAPSARCGAIPWPCCRSAAITWAIISGTGSRCSGRLTETPRIFHVNWFRKDADGKFLWPGFSENMRVLKWIVDRAHGRALGRETPIGWMPRYEDIDWNGLDFSTRAVRRTAGVRPRGVEDGSDRRTKSCSSTLHDHLPPEMIYERELLICRL